MKYSLLVLLAFCTICFSQPANGGYIKYVTSGATLSADKALNAMSGVHSCRNADSVSIRPAIKWGPHYVLKCIYNQSNLTQTYTLYDSTAEGGLDTFKLNLPAYTLSWPLPYCFLITGCIIDSTLFIRQYK